MLLYIELEHRLTQKRRNENRKEYVNARRIFFITGYKMGNCVKYDD